MTLRFAWQVFPGERPICVAIGVVWELAKLRFMAIGCTDLGDRQKCRGAALLALSLALSAGSIGASTGYLVQSQAKAHQAAVSTSRAYNDAVAALKNIDAQLQFLTESAARDVADKFRSRALATSATISEKQRERVELVQAVTTAEQSTVGSLGGGLPGNQAWVHLVVAVVIELINLVSMALLEALTTLRSVALPGPPCNPSSPTKKRSESRSKATGRRPIHEPSAASVFCTASAPCALPKTHTRRLRYTPGKQVESLLAALDCSAHLRSACASLLDRMGQHCLQVAGTNGALALRDILGELHNGLTVKTIRRYLNLLTDAGVLLHPDAHTYVIANFLEANHSTYQRKKFAEEQRRKECDRGRERRAGKILPKISAQFVELSGISAARPDKNPQPTTHQPLAAHAATHQPTSPQKAPAGREEFAPWEKYLTPCDEELPPIETYSEEVHDDETPLPALAPESKPVRQASRTATPCIKADVLNDSCLVDEHTVSEAFRSMGLSPGQGTLEMTFRQLNQMGIRQKLLSYAVWCYRVRSKKIRILDPLAYVTGIMRRQMAAA